MTLIAQARALLEAAFAPTQLEIVDTSAAHAGHHQRHIDTATGHLHVTIVSAAFAGQSQLARHRAIYAALQALLATTLHALVIDARTPEENAVTA